ncbi:T9SS type B sorting domain-containing protein [Chryseobacterium sp. ISL-6]|uniref:T9SS type B sorting domain-containing protein n=1 Tax=Chryseobacterium sp. ISL-6 TaxID=2819143 RepID=UPI001BE88BEB|nr:T9SS type B sorting domain-containing protein [Chryseobacterium sp. ISL-6]MBT2619164.1 T9SS type B sorting domain-containing protein [Chryseobacterium sp. ISL-6]
MRKTLFLFISLLSNIIYSQCNNCSKNFGDWVHDEMVGIKKTNNGFLYVYHYDNSTYSKMIKFDFNCNQIWTKTENIQSFTIDDQGNIYTLGTSGYYMNYVNKLTKYDSNGLLIWEKEFTGEVNRLAKNIFIHQNTVIVTGVFSYTLNFSNQVQLINNSGNTQPYPRAFIAKFDTNGNFYNAIQLGQNMEFFKDSEMDNDGNIYISKSHANFEYSKIEKFDINLQLILSKEISNNTSSYWAYCPTNLHYNKINNKMYVYGSFAISTKIDSIPFTTNSTSNGVIQSIITEFDTNNLSLLRYLKFYNNSYLEIPKESNSNTRTLNKAYFAETNNYLYVFGSFANSLTLGNTTITGSNPGTNNAYEDLVLFKINLSNFNPEYLVKSNTTIPTYQYDTLNAANEIFVNNDDIYLSANFTSKPIVMNGSTINNNSGNGHVDVLLYKYNSNSQNPNPLSSNSPVCNGSIIQLNATGGTTYNWTGPNGFTSNQQNPTIPNATVANSGTYTCHISGSLGCDGTFTVNVVVGDNIAPIPNIANLPDITGDCHTTISNFPAATDNCAGVINATTTDPLSYSIPGTYVVHWTYNDGHGNTATQNQNVIISSPALPVTTNPTQIFCLTNQPKVSDLQITGQNIKWYDANGNILTPVTALVNGQTYYASQTINGCESNKTAIQVTVNTTPKPIANTAQDFCASINPTLANLVVTGTSLVFYDGAGNILPLSTTLIHGQTYFVTQTINGCESEKQAIAVTLSVNNVPAQDLTAAICNDTTGATMSINLHSYEANIIANPNNYTFVYTDSTGNIIPNPSSYIMSIGSTVIHVKVSTADGCFTVVRLSLTLNPKPKINFPDQLDFCQGKTITLDAGAGFTSYLWNTGATTQTIVVSTPGNYSVKVTNSFGCENIASTQVSYSILAEIVSVTITNNSATILLSATGNYEYSLDNINWQDSNVFTNLSMGEYIVYVRTKSGCIIGQKNFSIFNIPNMITPNGDGFNDKWRIKGLENYTGTEIGVYDRKGIPVFKDIINKKPFEWDGKYNSTPLSTGNYWYLIKVSDGRIYNGWLLIKNRD